MVDASPREPETPADAGQPVSLGEYARQLRAVRAVPAYESASITPLPPRTEVKAVEPEISLGEYARQLRMQRAADEYMRLLAQDDPSIAAVLPREAIAPLRYHEIRATVAAPAPRQRRVVATVVAPESRTQLRTRRDALRSPSAAAIRCGSWRAPTGIGSALAVDFVLETSPWFAGPDPRRRGRPDSGERSGACPRHRIRQTVSRRTHPLVS